MELRGKIIRKTARCAIVCRAFFSQKHKEVHCLINFVILPIRQLTWTGRRHQYLHLDHVRRGQCAGGELYDPGNGRR